jgi:hypothetical protein
MHKKPRFLSQPTVYGMAMLILSHKHSSRKLELTTARRLSIIAINSNTVYSKRTDDYLVMGGSQRSSCTTTVRRSSNATKSSSEKSIRMGLSETTKTRLGVITALVVTGFGIGWLAGLSKIFAQ